MTTSNMGLCEVSRKYDIREIESKTNLPEKKKTRNVDISFSKAIEEKL
jgi:hypothetical protein